LYFYSLINVIFNALQYAILAEVVLSWVYQGRTNQYIELLHGITRPLLQPGRKIQDRLLGNTMIDFSPIIALVILTFLRKIVFGILGLIY